MIEEKVPVGFEEDEEDDIKIMEEVMEKEGAEKEKLKNKKKDKKKGGNDDSQGEGAVKKRDGPYTLKEIKSLKNQEFIAAVKEYLNEPNNKQLEVYVKHLKKNILLGFLGKADKAHTEGTVTKSRGGLFFSYCKEFVNKTNRDEEICVRIRDLLKKLNKNRNVVKSKKRKQKKREMMYGMVEGFKNMQLEARERELGGN